MSRLNWKGDCEIHNLFQPKTPYSDLFMAARDQKETRKRVKFKTLGHISWIWFGLPDDSKILIEQTMQCDCSMLKRTSRWPNSLMNWPEIIKENAFHLEVLLRTIKTRQSLENQKRNELTLSLFSVLN